MYYEYYGFNQPPFRITPDTSLFYPGGDRGAILDALLYAILNGEGIVKVVGEVGSGKTMLCRMLEKELPSWVEVVYLVNPSIAPENTLHAIAFELKLGIRPDTTRFEVMNELQQYLLKRHSENRQVVVFVEEAQAMPSATLEEIRLLSNLETRQSKLLQIVLFGQPELDEKISRPEIRQLKERITYSFELTPFKTDDIREYINTRVRACGYRAGELFDRAAVSRIERCSKGLLRRINILADKSLLAAFAENSRRVKAKHARMAIRDSEFAPRRPLPGRPILIGLLLGLLVSAVSGYFLFRAGTGGPAIVGDMDKRSEGAAVMAPAGPAARGNSSDPAANAGAVEFSGPIAVPDPPLTRVPAPAERDRADQGQGVEEISHDSATNVIPPVGEMENAGPVVKVTREFTGKLESRRSTMMEGEQGEVAEVLSDIPPLYRIQDLDDPRLNAGESAEMQQQLLKLPPEVGEVRPSVAGEVCERCWSIIYRPVWTRENL